MGGYECRISAHCSESAAATRARLCPLYHLDSQYSDFIQCFHVSRNGTLWVSSGAGLYRFDGDKFFNTIPELWVSRVEEASNAYLLVVTSKGFVEWDGARVIHHLDLPARLGVPYDGIYHVFEDRRGVCTKAGVAREINVSVERLQPYGQRIVAFRAYEDAAGTIWIAENLGLARVGAQGIEMITPDMNVRDISRLITTATCGWGTNGTGLFRFKNRVVTMFTSVDGLPKSIPMTVLAASDGKLWVGSNCGGVFRYHDGRFAQMLQTDKL